jgi:hypothetical protein
MALELNLAPAHVYDGRMVKMPSLLLEPIELLSCSAQAQDRSGLIPPNELSE